MSAPLHLPPFTAAQREEIAHRAGHKVEARHAHTIGREKKRDRSTEKPQRTRGGRGVVGVGVFSPPPSSLYISFSGSAIQN